MRWLVVGASRMLGQDLTVLLRAHDEKTVAVDREDLDIAEPRATAGITDGSDVVVTCAAFTAVDRAEGERAVTFAVNPIRAAGLDPAAVHPRMSETFARAAKRSACSVLSHRALEVVGVNLIGDGAERWVVAAPGP